LLVVSGRALELLKEKAKRYNLRVIEEDGITVIPLEDSIFFLLKYIARRKGLSIQDAVIEVLKDY